MLFSIKSIHSKRCPTIELSVYIKKEFTWLIRRFFYYPRLGWVTRVVLMSSLPSIYKKHDLTGKCSTFSHDIKARKKGGKDES